MKETKEPSLPNTIRGTRLAEPVSSRRCHYRSRPGPSRSAAATKARMAEDILRMPVKAPSAGVFSTAAIEGGTTIRGLVDCSAMSWSLTWTTGYSPLRSSGTSPNFRSTTASLNSPMAGSPARLNATAPMLPVIFDKISARRIAADGP